MKEVLLTSRQAHKDAIVSTACFRDSNNRKTPNLIFSSSEDGMIKLWDLREAKAVKLFRHPELKSDNLSNLQVDGLRNQLFIAAENKLLSFDIASEKLVLNEAHVQPISHDYINCLNLRDRSIAYVDDE